MPTSSLTFPRPTERQFRVRVTLYRFLNICCSIVFVVTKAIYGYKNDNRGMTTTELVCGIFALILNILGLCKSVARPTLWRLLHKDRAQIVQTIISRLEVLVQLKHYGDHSINVLCFDGGGVRGLSYLLILRSLMQQLSVSSNSPIMPLPCEIFDMICGTSTGGIIALMLGRLRMNVDEAIACYLDFSRTVFEERRAAGTKKVHISTYDASKLEEWIKGIVAKYAIDEDASLRDPFDGTRKICRTFVVATKKYYANSPPKLFRTYSWEGGGPADPCKVWEAARATCAAPLLFDPVTFGSPRETYIDGALSGSNNPSLLAIDEVDDVFPFRQLRCFLSLGTGVSDAIVIGDGLDEVAKSCMELLKDCDGVDNTVRKDFVKRKRKGAHGEYFRFSVDGRLGKMLFDGWTRDKDSEHETEDYMLHNDVQRMARSCVETLTARAVAIAAKKRDDDDLL